MNVFSFRIYFRCFFLACLPFFSWLNDWIKVLCIRFFFFTFRLFFLLFLTDVALEKTEKRSKLHKTTKCKMRTGKSNSLVCRRCSIATIYFSIQDKPIAADRDSANSSNRLIDDSLNRDQSFTPDTKTKENVEKTKTKRLATPSPLPPEVVLLL